MRSKDERFEKTGVECRMNIPKEVLEKAVKGAKFPLPFYDNTVEPRKKIGEVISVEVLDENLKKRWRKSSEIFGMIDTVMVGDEI